MKKILQYAAVGVIFLGALCYAGPKPLSGISVKKPMQEQKKVIGEEHKGKRMYGRSHGFGMVRYGIGKEMHGRRGMHGNFKGLEKRMEWVKGFREKRQNFIKDLSSLKDYSFPSEKVNAEYRSRIDFLIKQYEGMRIRRNRRHVYGGRGMRFKYHMRGKDMQKGEKSERPRQRFEKGERPDRQRRGRQRQEYRGKEKIGDFPNPADPKDVDTS